ncbi:MAG: CapA family protein [Methanobacterium sp.]|nr:CapA family protein [Methanobacterium sp.]
MTIIFTGDVMTGSSVETVLADGQNVFIGLTPIFNQSDLVVINLEAPFTNSTDNWKQLIPLKANPQYAHLLKDNHINVATLGNNHIMDYGPTGLYDTISVLKADNISYVGAGENLDQASQPTYISLSNKTIAILSFYDNTTFTYYAPTEIQSATNTRPGYAPASWEVVKKFIDTAKNSSDFVIVTFHYGNEYQQTHDQYQENLSRKSIDEGADLVIGNHAHITQDIEQYKGKLIFYSLGNCVFYDLSAGSPNSIIVEIKIENGTAKAIIHPIQVLDCSPRPMDNQSALSFLESIKAKSSANITIENGLGIINIGKI